MINEIIIGKDDCGNYSIKAIYNGKFYGSKWNSAIRFIGYSKKEAEKCFREKFGLQNKRFTYRIETPFKIW